MGMHIPLIIYVGGAVLMAVDSYEEMLELFELLLEMEVILINNKIIIFR